MKASSNDVLHVWAAGGYDGWDDSIWASGACNDKTCAVHRASGVAIPTDVIDELVVMRLAGLIAEGTVAAAIERACAKYKGNGGCELLVTNAKRLVAALTDISLEARLADLRRLCEGPE